MEKRCSDILQKETLSIMRRVYFKFFFVAAIIAISAIPSWSQTARLQGKVLDPAQSAPIAGVDVTVVAKDGSVLRTTITGPSGSYLIEGLPLGIQVTVKYRKEGYSPDPASYDISLSHEQTIQNVTLNLKSARLSLAPVQENHSM